MRSRKARVTAGVAAASASCYAGPMRWQALVLATPLAGLALALLELTRLPAEVAGEPARLLAALAQLARSAASQFALPALVFLLAALLLAFARRFEGRRRSLALAALVGLGVAEAALAREVLIVYGPFAWSWSATLALAAAGLALGGGLAWLATDALDRRAAATRVGGALFVLASLMTARAHYAFYVGLYPTLHECVLVLCFAGSAVGLALVLATADRAPVVRRAAVLIAAPLALFAVLEPPASAEARPYVLAYTELGRAAGVARALRRDADLLAPRGMPPPRTGPLFAPDEDAERRFAERSGLPALPDDFDLSDSDVLLVLSDATRHDRTSLARADGPTPHLAALAESSLVFERAYAPSNGTFPSLASMLAMAPVSLTELDVQPRFWRGRLRAERTTAAEAMRAAGRATFWIGHDHAGCFSDHIHGLEQGFDARTLVPDTADADARIAELAVDAMRERRDAGRRFFGLVFFGSPHDEYLARDPRRSPTALERYDSELAYADAQFGRLVASLERDGALERTVVIFAGDHGEAFGEHGHRFHLSSVYDEQIHVPLVVRVPGVSAARSARPTSTAYVLPWLLSRGAPAEREAAWAVLREDVGPFMRALDGAVASEMIGPRSQEVALVFSDHAVLYDVLADVVRVFDAREDPAQRHDLREDRPDLLGHFVPLVRRYRDVRRAGRRFRFVSAP